MDLVNVLGTVNATLFGVIVFFLKKIYSQHEINSQKIRDLDKDLKHLNERLLDVIQLSSRVSLMEKHMAVLLYASDIEKDLPSHKN